MRRKKSVADHASEFTQQAKSGLKPRVFIARAYIEDFLQLLARDGFGFARKCLDQIIDPALRRAVETIFFATLGGAAGGAALGGMIGGPAGAGVGAAVGAGVGFLAGALAVTIVGVERDGGLLLTVE